MSELTFEQRQAVALPGEMPPRTVDVDTRTTYVLIPEEKYARVKAFLEEEEENPFLHGHYDRIMEVFGRDGWEYPSMDIYHELDPAGNCVSLPEI